MNDSTTDEEDRRGDESNDIRGFDFIPNSWRVVRISDIFNIQPGVAMSAERRQGKAPRPFLRTSNVLWGRIDISNVDKMDFSEEEVGRLALRPGDLLVCEGGEIGRTAIWRGEIEDCCYQNHLHRLRAKDEQVIPEFYMYWMEAAWCFLAAYVGRGNITTIPNLSKTRLGRLEVPFPAPAEQRAVVRALNASQKAIEANEQATSLLRELYKTMLKNIMTGDLETAELEEE